MIDRTVVRNIVSSFPTAIESTRVKDSFDALTTVGEGRRVAAGLTCLAERHSRNVGIDVLRTSPKSVLVVVHSEEGQFSGRSAEVHMHLSGDDDFEVPDPVLFVTGSDDRTYTYRIPQVLATWTVTRALRKVGELIACKQDLVESWEVSVYLEACEPQDHRELFDSIGRGFLGRLISSACEPWERFAPAPLEPLFIRRARPWIPGDYRIPAGYIVEDILDVPANAVFTAVFSDGDKHGYRGVTPPLCSPMTKTLSFKSPHRLDRTGYRESQGQIVRNEYPEAAGADHFVVHERGDATLREVGAVHSPEGGVSLPEDYDYDVRHKTVRIEGEGYTGPLPGEPRRKIVSNVYGGRMRDVSVQEQRGGSWVGVDGVFSAGYFSKFEEPWESIEHLLPRKGLCLSDIELPEPNPEEAAQAPAAETEADDDGIPDWERQLTEASEDAE